MPSGTGIAPPRCHPPPDGGTLRHVNNSLPGPASEGSVHGNGSRQPDNWLSALADPFVTVLAHGNGVIAIEVSPKPQPVVFPCQRHSDPRAVFGTNAKDTARRTRRHSKRPNQTQRIQCRLNFRFKVTCQVNARSKFQHRACSHFGSKCCQT